MLVRRKGEEMLLSVAEAGADLEGILFRVLSKRVFGLCKIPKESWNEWI